MPEPENPATEFASFPLAAADSCVKCGLCLPHCPTYTLSGMEGDSPRGRIALMQGLAHGVLQPEGSTTEHLDGCLTCRACETVCPANVPYGELIDSGRAGLWQAGHRPGWRWRLLAWWRRTPGRIQLLGRLLQLLELSQLRRVASWLPLRGLARNARLLGPAANWPAPGHYPAHGSRRGQVALFLGCVARPLDGRVARAALDCLNALGYDVDLPAAQGCCGAMDQHAGDRDTAQAHAERNRAAFDPAVPLLATASGCGIHLQESLGSDVQDATAFISDALQGSGIELQARPQRLLLHTPCTLRQMGGGDAVARLLEQLPGARVERLAHAHCCGAAGSYLFEQPQASAALADRSWAAVEQQAAEILVTSNIGCALQLRDAASRHRSRLPVRHPLELLAARLPRRN